VSLVVTQQHFYLLSFGKMALITFVKAAAFVAAIAPLEAFMPASTFGVKQVREICIGIESFVGRILS
jgi:hypothetical protein